uniref:Uncharacterized protein n=1 Tax=Leptocylindrus danicus TaxID=163516 RepID=A0A7S2NUU0_9STRA|mmetsp:Transcript_13080/g.19583  ORF Transcript_13080/g.19583 Transcript_13080/m.19583 type:complete len:298 (+) Transcript_13080:138-1031(+)|eukprot:CAMPEP_0116029400 /NCGR_PEP_ID=MMETSP0321-20121206/16120_1 /TAXON_ID=163516 /ORGANISM="Leptocylindrus danicus var. danicus, Strain B650" /LENGTH=297 /DNA_ID=CAMNT_0003503775 /DNA_START=110 /DNA_END=1003 /DNA_ORIENTATION=-
MSSTSGNDVPQQADPASSSMNTFAPFEEQALPVSNEQGSASSNNDATTPIKENSAENVIPTRQIRDGWGKTMTGLNSAWKSTRQATDRFVKNNKLDETWIAAKEKTIKVSKDLELERKWKASTTKVGEVAKDIGSKVQNAIGNKNKPDDNVRPVVPDIPPSSAPIIYMDLNQQQVGGPKNQQDSAVAAPASAPVVSDAPAVVVPEAKIAELKISEEAATVVAPPVVVPAAAAAVVVDDKKKEEEEIFVAPTPEPAAAETDDAAMKFSIDDDDDDDEEVAFAPTPVPAPVAVTSDEAK